MHHSENPCRAGAVGELGGQGRKGRIAVPSLPESCAEDSEYSEAEEKTHWPNESFPKAPIKVLTGS